MIAIWTRINTVLLVLVLFALLAVIGTLAARARGGSLDPTGSPASTMKSLDDIPGSWHRTLAADNGATGPNPPAGCDSSRFECLDEFNNEAVLDRETGLVWTRDASVGTAGQLALRVSCSGLAVADRMGWRLPSIDELTALRDPSTSDGLPTGHPFIDHHTEPGTGLYWSSTQRRQPPPSGSISQPAEAFQRRTERTPTTGGASEDLAGR